MTREVGKKIDIKENLGKANLRPKILTVDKVALSI